MTLKVVRTLAEADWRRFVDEHPDGNIYHTPDMFRVFETTAGYEPTLWAVVDSSSQPLALLLPVSITLMDGLLRRFTTRAVVYGSILVSPTPPGRQALSLLLETYQNETKSSAIFTELRNMSDLSTQQTFLNEKKFIFEDHLNFLIDLTPTEDQLWQNVKKKCRQHIRTSRNKGTQVHRITERSELTAAYTILQQVYTRSQIPLSDLSLFEAAFDILGPKGMFIPLLAQVDGQNIGAVLLLAYNGRLLDWYAGSDRDFSAYCPGELLIWHALEMGQQQGYHLFDFGGAGKPDEEYGPRDFKAKFGGNLVNYGRNVYVHQPTLLRLSKQGYELYRRFL